MQSFFVNKFIKKRILKVRIFGGIGNQLFCYAVAKSLAIQNDAKLLIDHYSSFKKDPYNRIYQLDNFNISSKKFIKGRFSGVFYKIYYKFLYLISNLSSFENRIYIKHEGVNFDKRVLNIRPKRITYLEGCWQSEKYFKKNQLIIKNEFKIKPPKDKKNIDLFIKIKKTESVFIHYRFFDNSDKSLNNTNPKYYSKAIDILENKLNNPHYYIFTDNFERVLKFLPLQKQRYTMVDFNQGEFNAYKDLWLMTNCKHAIIANSTFSWWGAWLIDNPSKTVIAPNFKIQKNKSTVTAWGFKGLLPKNWIKIQL